MPFTLSAAGSTYEPRGNGLSVKSTITFADPANEFRFRAGSVKNKILSAGVTRLIEKDVVSGGTTVRENMVITINFQLPSNGVFSQTEVDTALAEISEALTSSVISRLLQGEA